MSITEHPRRGRRLLDLHRPLGDRLGDLDDVDRLERLLVQGTGHRLAGDADDRDRVGVRGVEAGDHVGAGRARGADRDADPAVRAGPAVGHVRGTFLVPHGQVLDAPDLLHGLVQREDRRTRAAEGHVDTFVAQDLDDGFHRGHLRHVRLPSGR
jgi:hypothetical protein